MSAEPLVDLSGLPEDWCVLRTETGWAVGKIGDSCHDCLSSFGVLAEAPTIPEAIDAAVVEAARREREEAARRASYQRRKAEGKLTPIEQSVEFLTNLLSRMTYDTRGGERVIIPHISNYEALRVERKPDA